jgi:hypothetical protein
MTECLKDCIERVVPYWEKEIAPELKAGKVRFGGSFHPKLLHFMSCLLVLSLEGKASFGFSFQANWAPKAMPYQIVGSCRLK